MDIELSTVIWWLGWIAGAIVLWVLVGYPKWRVWAAHQQGLADLQRARNEQQIQVSVAQGRLDGAELNKQATVIEEIADAEARFKAAELNKKAAIIEAEAVSAQIKEIGTQLTSHDLYLRWQWIKMMEDIGAEGTQTIYVPTEANLPILETQRLNKKAQ